MNFIHYVRNSEMLCGTLHGLNNIIFTVTFLKLYYQLLTLPVILPVKVILLQLLIKKAKLMKVS